MNFMNITSFVLINYLEKDHSMIKTCRLKNVVIFFPNNCIISGVSEVLVLAFKFVWDTSHYHKHNDNLHHQQNLQVFFVNILLSEALITQSLHLRNSIALLSVSSF